MLARPASVTISGSGSDRQRRIAAARGAKTGARCAPPSPMKWDSHSAPVTRLNLSRSGAVCATSVSMSGAKRMRVDTSAGGTRSIASRSSHRAPYAAWRISRLPSESISKRPGSKSGAWSSMSTPGTASSAATHPTSSCLTYGFSTPMCDTSSGMNSAPTSRDESMPLSPPSITTSFSRRS